MSAYFVASSLIRGHSELTMIRSENLGIPEFSFAICADYVFRAPPIFLDRSRLKESQRRILSVDGIF